MIIKISLYLYENDTIDNCNTWFIDYKNTIDSIVNKNIEDEKDRQSYINDKMFQSEYIKSVELFKDNELRIYGKAIHKMCNEESEKNTYFAIIEQKLQELHQSLTFDLNSKLNDIKEKKIAKLEKNTMIKIVPNKTELKYIDAYIHMNVFSKKMYVIGFKLEDETDTFYIVQSNEELDKIMQNIRNDILAKLAQNPKNTLAICRLHMKTLNIKKKYFENDSNIMIYKMDITKKNIKEALNYGDKYNMTIIDLANKTNSIREQRFP